MINVLSLPFEIMTSKYENGLVEYFNTTYLFITQY